MIVTGVSEEVIQSTIDSMGIQVSQTFKRLSKNRVQVSLRARGSRDRYARWTFLERNVLQRRSISLCWHGFRDFIREMFNRGASRVQSKVGVWHSREEFEDGLRTLARTNIGSTLEPVYLGLDNECECDDDLY